MPVYERGKSTDMKNAVERYVAGEPLNAIAADFRCTPALIIHYARKAGVPSRRVTKPKQKACEHCGTTYTPPSANRSRRFCSAQCRAIGASNSLTVAKAGLWPAHVSRTGYRTVSIPEGHVSRLSERARRNRIPEHVLFAEAALGRPLRDGEVVHHINCDKLDNRPSNLLICERSYHAWLHGEMSRRWAREHLGG